VICENEREPFTMLYFRFLVAAGATHPAFPDRVEAIAHVICERDDARECVHLAFNAVKKHHWEVLRLERTRVGDSPEALGLDEQVYPLFDAAKKAGLAIEVLVHEPAVGRATATDASTAGRDWK
jgi:hypothetical protein